MTPCKVQSQWHCVKKWPELLYWDLSVGGTKGVPWGSAGYKQPYRVHCSVLPAINWPEAWLSYNTHNILWHCQSHKSRVTRSSGHEIVCYVRMSESHVFSNINDTAASTGPLYDPQSFHSPGCKLPAHTHAGDIRLQSDSSWVDRHQHLWGTHLISTLKMEEVWSKWWHQSTKLHSVTCHKLKFYVTIKLASCCVVNSWKSWGNLHITLKCHALQKTFLYNKKCNYITISYKNILYSIIQQNKKHKRINMRQSSLYNHLHCKLMQSTKTYNKIIHSVQSHTL